MSMESLQAGANEHGFDVEYDGPGRYRLIQRTDLDPAEMSGRFDQCVAWLQGWAAATKRNERVFSI